MTSRTPLEYRAMAQTQQDLDLYAECFARNGPPRDRRLLRWMHLENPTGRALVELAITPEPPTTVAGIYAVMPVWARLGTRRVLACQSLDTLTDEAFRGQGLFVRMAKAAYARAEQSEVAFVYGFPNGNSAHGFFTRLEWTSMDPIPFLVRPLRTRLAAQRIAPKIPWLPDFALPAPAPRLASHQDFRSIARFGAPHQEIWDAFSAGIGITVDRDPAYLNWRLRDKPGHAYRIIALEERGRLLGSSPSPLRRNTGAGLAICST
jgi:hypothetical protein